MAYSVDLPGAARRHFNAAERLREEENRGTHDSVAGYLYGVAAECALKQIMRESGMRPLRVEERREDPFYAHFPELKRMLRDRVEGRRASTLRKYAEDASLMQEWDTDMRYAPGRDVLTRHVERWRTQAHALVNAIEE